MPWDAFISHASEDKEVFVRPLASALAENGLEVWYDDFELRVGDSLLESINRGLAESDYGIVILSPAFFEKQWPQRELAGLVARETGEHKIILPVWHDIGVEEIRRRSPILADRKAARSESGLEQVVRDLLRVIRATPITVPGTRAPRVEDKLWEDPLAPLTLDNLMAYSRSKDNDFDWRSHSQIHYALLRRLCVNTMAQLREAIEDEESRAAIAEMYARLLDREPDWAGIFAHQPLVFMEGFRGLAFVEQSILASAEYRRKQLQSKDSLEPNAKGS